MTRLINLLALCAYLFIAPASAQTEDTIQEVVIPPGNTGEGTMGPDDVWTIVEQMPEFPGGNDAMYQYLAANLKYPKEASKAGIQGVVYVNFIVDREGNITGPRVLRGIGGGCDEEAVRVVGSMPPWIPGQQRGKTVNVQYNLPLRFKL